MRFANWFRIAWWVVLQIVLGTYLWARMPDLLAGRAAAADVIVFLVLVALALAPIYEDVALFGFRVKQHLQKLESEIGGLKSEIRNAVDVRNQFSPSIVLQPQLSPEKLDELAAEVRQRAQAGGAQELQRQPPTPADDQTVSMFRMRLGIEQELRRIMLLKFTPAETDAFVPVPKIARLLNEAQLIDRDAAVATEELYRITSQAIHGRDILPSQAKFAFDVYGWLLAELKAIR